MAPGAAAGAAPPTVVVPDAGAVEDVDAIEKSLQSVREVRERLTEIGHSGAYGSFLRDCVPRLRSILERVPPQLSNATTLAKKSQELRKMALEVLHRLHPNEVLRPFVAQILELATEQLNLENEDNGLVCLRIIADMHKTYRPSDLVAQLIAFFDFCKKLLAKLPTTVQVVVPPDQLRRTHQSFLVLAECPPVIILLFQIHRTLIPQYVPEIVPLIVMSLKQQPSPPRPDLVACQVKILSFLTYLIRSVSNAKLFQEFETDIARSVVALMEDLPSSQVALRKDLLTSTRHIIATEFRRGFFPFVDKFLDETVLLGGAHWMGPSQGSGAQPIVPSAAKDMLPLAYSTLADLIHHVRANLKLTQVSKVVYIFSRNLHDPNLPLTLQTTSVRLLLNLVDRIFHNRQTDPNVGRQLLVHILHTIVQKFGALRFYIPEIVVRARKRQRQRYESYSKGDADKPIPAYYYTRNPSASNSDSAAAAAAAANAKVVTISVVEQDGPLERPPETLANMLKLGPEAMHSSSSVVNADGVKECKGLIQTMVLGLKTVLWCVCNYGHKKFERSAGDAAAAGEPAPDPDLFRGLSGLLGSAEMGSVANLLQWGLQCIPIFRHQVVPDEDAQENSLKHKRKLQAQAAAQEIEIVNQFAEVFTVLDPHNFADLFRANINLLYANILRHPLLITFPKRLLRKNSVSHAFMAILFDFCLDRFQDLAGPAQFSKKHLVAMPSLTNIISGNSGPPTSFRNVPKSGPNAAATHSGLGLADPPVATAAQAAAHAARKRQHPDQRSPSGSSTATSFTATSDTAEDAVVDSDDLADQSFQQQVLNERARPESNAVAVLSQLMELVLFCVESYADESIAGPPPPGLQQQQQQQQQQPQHQNQADQAQERLSPGWQIVAHLKARVEKLMVLCFVLAPTMTSSPLSEMRQAVANPLVLRFQGRDRENASLLNQSGALGATGGTSLGRDCYLMTLRSLLRVVARRQILQELIKPKINALLVPGLRALSQLLHQAQGPMLASREARKDLIVEVVLLLAVRISRHDLNEFLPLLQRAFEVALEANEHRNTELVRLALRILESWVDNLGPEEFEALFLQDTPSTFAQAIASLLRPSPQPCGTGALRVLGKLGRRVRNSLLQVSPAHPLRPAADSVRSFVVEMFWSHSHQVSFPKLKLCLDQVVRHAVSFLDDTYQPNLSPTFPTGDLGKQTASGKRPRIVTPTVQGDKQHQGEPTDHPQPALTQPQPVAMVAKLEDCAYYKTKAVRLLFVCVAHFLDTSDLGELPNFSADAANSPTLSALQSFLDGKHDHVPFFQTPPTAQSQGVASMKSAQRDVLVSVLTGLATASCDHAMGPSAWSLFRGVVQFLYISGMAAAVKQADEHGNASWVMETGIDRLGKAQLDEEGLNSSKGNRSRSSSNSSSTHQNSKKRKRVSSFASTGGADEEQDKTAAAPMRCGHGVDPTVVNEMIARTITTACPAHSKFALFLIDDMVATMTKAIDVDDLAASRATPLLDDLMRRFIRAAHSGRWTDRLGGCLGLRHMMNLLGRAWVAINEPALLEAFVFALQTYTEPLGMDVFFHVSSGLQELIVMLYDQAVGNIAEIHKKAPKPQKSIKLLLQALVSPNRHARVALRQAMVLLAKCNKVTLGKLLLEFPEDMKDIRKLLLSRSVTKRPVASHAPILETITFLLDQDQAPLDISGEMKKRVVQTMADAILLAETAVIEAPTLSYIRCTSPARKALPQQQKKKFADSATTQGVLASGPYPFQDIPHQPLVTMASVGVIASFLQSGSVDLLKELDSTDMSKKVRDRGVKLVITSALSPWPTVAKTAQRGLRIVSELSREKIGEAPDALGIPAATMKALLQEAMGAVERGHEISSSMLMGVLSIVEHFNSKHMVSLVVNSLLRHLASVMVAPPSTRPLRIESDDQIQPRLTNLTLAGEIVRVLGSFPETNLVPHLKLLIHNIIRLENAPERLTVDAAVNVKPNTAPFLDVHGHLSSPLKAPFLLICSTRFPKQALSVLLQAESLHNQDSLRFLKHMLGMTAASKLRNEITNLEPTSAIINNLFAIVGLGADEKPNKQELMDLCFHGIDIVRIVVQFSPSWLALQTLLMHKILAVWRNREILSRLKSEERLSWAEREYLSNVCTIFKLYFRYVSHQLNNIPPDTKLSSAHSERATWAAALAFEMLTVVVVRTSADNSSLLRFFAQEVTSNSPVTLRVALMRHYVHLLVLDKEQVMSSHIKEAALRLIVIPTLAWSFRDAAFKSCKIDCGNGRMLGDKLVEEITQHASASAPVAAGAAAAAAAAAAGSSSSSSSPSSAADAASVVAGPAQEPPSNDDMEVDQDDLDRPQVPVVEQLLPTSATLEKFTAPESLFDDTAASSEALQVQLLRLATLLIANYGDELIESRKDLIKFAWNHLKNTDASSKQWAYVNICTFINVYQIPPDIILQVFVALLREHGPESKELVQRSLDVLVPALGKRLQVNKFLRTIRWAKKIVFDEGHKMPQLTHIWSLLVRHPELFYLNRHHFLPNVIASLSKLCLPQSGVTGIENRELALDLTELFFRYEQTREAEEQLWKRIGADLKDTPNDQLSEKQLAAKEAEQGFKANLTMATVVTHFLMRLIIILGDSKSLQSVALRRRALSLFKVSLEFAAKVVRKMPPGSHLTVRFLYIDKHVELIRKKQQERLAQFRGSPKGATPATTAPGAAGSKYKNITGKEDAKVDNTVPSGGASSTSEEDPGMMSSILDLVNALLTADRDAVVAPFVRGNVKHLAHLVSPVFSSVERGCRDLFLLATTHLRKLLPLGQEFFDVLLTALDKRLLLAADDGKRAIQEAVQNYVRAQAELRDRLSSNEGGTKGKRSSAKNALQSKAAHQKAAKAVALRKAQELGAGPLGTLQNLNLVQVLCLEGDVAIDTSEENGYTTVKGSGEYKASMVDKFVGTLMKLMAKYVKELTTGANVRARNASNTAKSLGGSATLLVAIPPRTTEVELELASRGLCITLDILSSRILHHEVHRRNFILLLQGLLDKLDVHDEQVLCTILRISQAWLTAPIPTAPPSTEKHEVTSHALQLNMKERQQLMAKLEQLERFSGLIQANQVLKQYRELVYKTLNPLSSSARERDERSKSSWRQQLLARFMTGLLSHDVVQRHQFFRAFVSMYFQSKGPFAKLQLLFQLDWSHVLEANWLPVAVETVLSAVNHSSFVEGQHTGTVRICRVAFEDEAVHEATSANGQENRASLLQDLRNTLSQLRKLKTSEALLYPIQELAHGDRSAHIAHAAWMEVFPQAWEVLEEQEKMTMTQGLQVFLSRGYHLPHSAVYFGAVQRCAVMVQHALDEIAKLVASSKTHKVRQGIAADPFQENLQTFSLRRVAAWARVQGWGAPSTVQSIFESMLMLRPLPLLAPELLQFVGKTHGVRHQAIEMTHTLARQVPGVARPTRDKILNSLGPTAESLSMTSPPGRGSPEAFASDATETVVKKKKKKGTASAAAAAAVAAAAAASAATTKNENNLENAKRWTSTVMSLFEGEDDDMVHGIVRQWCVTASSFAGMAHEVSSSWHEAEKVYMDAMERVRVGRGEYIVPRQRPTDNKQHGFADFVSPVPTGGTNNNNNNNNNPGQSMSLEDALADFDDFGMLDDLPFDSLTGGNAEAADALMMGSGDPAEPFQQRQSHHDQSGGAYFPGGQEETSQHLHQHEQHHDHMWLSKQVSGAELTVWHRRWEQCAQQLGLWEEIAKVATVSNDTDTILESATRAGAPNWQGVIKPLIEREEGRLLEVQSQLAQERPHLPPNLYPNLLGARPALVHISLAVQESRPSQELDNVWRRSANAILLDWAVRGQRGGVLHQRSLLVSCQRLVELEESISYLSNIVNVATMSKSGTNAVMSPTKSNQIHRMLQRWRERVPSSCEDPTDWDDLLCSRLNIFSLGARSFERSALKRATSQGGNDLKQAQIQLLAANHDTRWTILERAKAYRKNGMVDKSLEILASPVLSQGRMSAEEVFMVLRERVLNVLQCDRGSVRSTDKARHLSGALVDLLSLDMSIFSSENKAEVLRLRAKVQGELSDPPDVVHGLFAQSVHLHSTHALSWLDWAEFTQGIMRHNATQIPSEQWPLVDRELGAIVVGSILQAVKHGSELARSFMPLVFWNLHLENEFSQQQQQQQQQPQQASISTTFMAHLPLMPSWVWLPWIPQVISMLSGDEPASKIGKAIISLLAKEFPNAIYYNLRAQYFEKESEKRHAAKQQRESSGACEEDAAASAAASPEFRLLKESLTRFNQLNPTLVQELEGILESLVSAFKVQHPFDELYATMHRLLEKCIQVSTALNVPSDSTVTKEEAEKLAPESLRLVNVWTMLDRVCDKLFSQQNLQRSALHNQLLTRLQGSFEKDFRPDKEAMRRIRGGEATDLVEPAGGRDMSFAGIVHRIGMWKQMFADALYVSGPNEVALHEWSRDLATCAPQSVQIPGMHMMADNLGEPMLINHPELVGFAPEVLVRRDAGQAQPCLGFLATTGSVTHFALKSTAYGNTKSDQRTVQLQTVLNQMLTRTNCTRRRSFLRFSLPVVVPIHSRLALQLHSADTFAVSEVFDTALRESRGTLEGKMTTTLHQLELMHEKRAGAAAWSREHAFEAVCREVPDDLLSVFLRTRVDSAHQLHLRRDVMAKQLALSAALTFMLSASERMPSKTLLRPDGTLLELDLRPKYKGGSGGEIEDDPSVLHVPFRLTRNIVQFLTPAGVDGPLHNTLIAAATCMCDATHRSALRSYLEFYLLHDLVDQNSRHSDKSLFRSRSLHRVVEANTQVIMRRVEILAAPSTPQSDDVKHPLSEASPEEVAREVVLQPSQTSGLAACEPKINDNAVAALIQRAKDPAQQALMDATWLPWF
ncbi:Transcription-associated protein 1 (dTRA1) [Durusdinium trenchii]|uniref:Transcription-associated protein 1 (DTRA1) n=1 Tax=Durusdinium trenchii TaxID=1381693 RepID=A0ABP0R6I8_9DINO